MMIRATSFLPLFSLVACGLENAIVKDTDEPSDSGQSIDSADTGTRPETAETGDTDTGTIPVIGANYEIRDHFDYFDTITWEKSDNWSNGDPFNVGWEEDNVTTDISKLVLQLDNTGCPEDCSDKPYKSGEVRSIDFFGYGTYEVKMKAATDESGNAPAGIVSAFFIYTGPAFDDTWHEVDVAEIKGINVWKNQVTFYHPDLGINGSEEIIDLDFDSSADYHTYTLNWTPDSITWSIDGTVVRTETENLPDTAMKIYFNMWAVIDSPDMEAWAGHFDYTSPVKAYYEYITFEPYAG